MNLNPMEQLRKIYRDKYKKMTDKDLKELLKKFEEREKFRSKNPMGITKESIIKEQIAHEEAEREQERRAKQKGPTVEMIM